MIICLDLTHRSIPYSPAGKYGALTDDDYVDSDFFVKPAVHVIGHRINPWRILKEHVIE